MGMALSGDKLALGTKMQVWQYVDVPAVTAKLEPPGPARRLLPAPLQPLHGATSRFMRWPGALATSSGS